MSESLIRGQENEKQENILVNFGTLAKLGYYLGNKGIVMEAMQKHKIFEVILSE